MGLARPQKTEQERVRGSKELFASPALIQGETMKRQFSKARTIS
jgi:hypothetical protein